MVRCRHEWQDHFAWLPPKTSWCRKCGSWRIELDEDSRQNGRYRYFNPSWMSKEVVDLVKVREAIADYMRCEGCSCCRNNEGHAEAKKRIAEMLGVPMYKDGSGWNFGPFESGEFGEKIIVEEL